MILKFRVYEQTISLQATKSEPRQGSKDYLELQFLFSPDWNDLLKYVYLQHGEVSVPHDLEDGSVIVDEYFTEQTEFNVTLFGKSADGSIEVPTNVVTVFLKESNNLWEKDAPEPQNSWFVQVADARDEALAAAIRAENAVIHQPYPNEETGTWWVWSAETGKYEDTGESYGVSVTHSWNGTVLTVTSASGTSSADLKGDKGDKGDTGATGKDGATGADGKTPVKGTDYFTNADKQEIAEAAAELVDVPTTLPTPNKLTFTGAVNAEFDGSEAVTVEIPSGGSGVTSWNDLTDKPFGETTTVKEVLAECQLNRGDSGDGGLEFLINDPVKIVPGEKYIVNWNGVEYQSTAINPGADDLYVGNLVMAGMEDTGEPYVLQIYAEPIRIEYDNFETVYIYGVAIPLDGSTTLTISIRQEVTTVQKMSGKYVEGMGYTEKSESVVLEECQPEFNEIMQGGLIGQGQEMVLTVGETYIVTIDGTEYHTLPAVDMTTMGDERMWVGLVNEGANLETGEGLVFMVMSFVPEFAAGVHCPGMIRTIDGSVPATISIRQETEIIHPIDPNLLPSVGGGATSWNDLEDKPFGTDIGMVDIVPEITLTFNDDGNGVLPTAPDLTTGNEYTVVWNGTEYKCIAQDAVAEGMRVGVGIGDIGLMTGGTSTGEPFVIVAVDPSMIEALGATNTCVALDGSTTATISVVGIGEVVNKLDNKYLDLDWFPTTENGCLLNDRRGLVSGDLLYGFNKTTLEDIDSVVVVYDHVRYTCTVYKESEIWFIGNLGALTGISTGEPFFINVTGGNNSQIQFMDENEHDVYIFDPNGIGTVYNKMPSEFMPPDSVFFVYFDMKNAGNITCLNATFDDVREAIAQNKLVIGVYANTNSRKTYYMLTDGSTDTNLYFTKNGNRANTSCTETIVWNKPSATSAGTIVMLRAYFVPAKIDSNGNVRYISLFNTDGRKVRIGVDADNKLYVEEI